MTMDDFDAVNKTIHEKVHEDANIIVGVVIDEEMKDSVKVTAIVTGFGDRFEIKDHTRRGYEHASQPVPKPQQKVVSIETPTYIRDQQRSRSEGGRPTRHVGAVSIDDEDQYDIPTFLRKSVD